MKDAASYHRSTKRGIAEARAAGKPFCLNINISDPHKPFWNPGDPNPASQGVHGRGGPGPRLPLRPPRRPRGTRPLLHQRAPRRRLRWAPSCAPSRSPARPTTPPSSSSPTTACRCPSPRPRSITTPPAPRCSSSGPGITKPGSIDDTHMVSAVDLPPTILDIVGAKHPEGFDGRSFAPAPEGRNTVRARLRLQGLQRERRRQPPPDARHPDQGPPLPLQPVVRRHEHLQDRHHRAPPPTGPW